MNKLIRLSHSGIEYLDYVWNFYSGCWNWKNGVCPIEKCWAKGITERFKRHYPNGFEPTYYPEAFLSPLYLKKPSIIGVAFMGDLFGDWVNPNMKFHSSMPSGKASVTISLKGWITTTIKQCPQHRFLFLTKQPQNLIKWSFPENCYVGVTVTGKQPDGFVYPLTQIKAKVKFISFEPLLDSCVKDVDSFSGSLKNAGIDWLIIGACTGTLLEMAKLVDTYSQDRVKPYTKNIWTLQPKIEWVQEIVEAADKAGIRVFLKDNLMPLFKRGDIWGIPEWAGFNDWSKQDIGTTLRQEIPKP